MTSTFLRILLLIACCVSSSVMAAGKSLPDLPGPADAVLSTQQEFDMGRAWLRQLRQRVPILTDPLIQEYAEHLVWQLMAYSQIKHTKLDLVVINTSNINAFAVPGGVIGLNAGTILNADNEDEVAAVLAHELAHISQHHFTRRYTDSRYRSKSLLLAMLASIALAAAGHAEAGMAGMATSEAAAIQTQLAYSRSQEAEADRIGMKTLSKAGFNPNAMPAFFQKLLRVEQYSSEPPKFLLDHPVTESRIADTRLRANTLPAHPYHSSLAFLLTRARLIALYAHKPNQALNYFKKLYHEGDSHQQLAAGYGLMLASLRTHDFSLADTILPRLIKAAPNCWWFKAAQAEASMQKRDFSNANNKLANLLKLLPGNYAVSVLYARSLLQSGKPKHAQKLLHSFLQTRPEDPVVWQLSAKAFGKMNKKARSHLARGEYLFLTGHGKKGLQQLQYALQSSKTNFSVHSLVKARLKAMQKAKNQTF